MKYNYKPSLGELRSSLKCRSREYFLENTLHGVPYFVDTTRPKWERVTWFFLTVMSLIAIVLVIVIILDKFETEPTITGLDIMTDHINVDFPQIFVCFDWAQLNHSHILKGEMSIYEKLYDWSFRKDSDIKSSYEVYKNKNNFRRVFEMLKPDCDLLISDCVYSSRYLHFHSVMAKQIIKDVFEKGEDNFNIKGRNISCNKLFTTVLAPVGACCKTIKLEPLTLIDLAWNLEFKTASSNFPLRLYVTEQSNIGPQPGERHTVKAYFPVDIEFIVDITYTTPDISYLLLRQRKCYFKQEGVNLNDCEINCFINKLFARCKCLPWFLSSVDKPECPLSKYSCLNYVRVDFTHCDCWLSCDHTSYTVNAIKQSLKNITRIALRNWPTALYKREMKFGYLDLLVSFGGIASLFLGYSLLISVELGYYFSLRTYCGAVVESSRRQYNIVTVHVVEKLPPKVNTNSTYYHYVD